MSTFSDTYLAANAEKLPAATLSDFRSQLELLDEGQVAMVLAGN